MEPRRKTGSDISSTIMYKQLAARLSTNYPKWWAKSSA